PDKFIVFLGRTFSGHNHDSLMLKQEFPPELDWFTDINLRVDLGYLGIRSDYRGDQIDIPTKKPRKSKKNPPPQLSAAQKAANTALSQVRIFVEHAIGGMKRYNILVHGFRNHKANFEDDVIGVCARLWNFVLTYTYCLPRFCPLLHDVTCCEYNRFPTYPPLWQGTSRRRKDGTDVDTTARGVVERLHRFSRRLQPHDRPSGRVRRALPTGAGDRGRSAQPPPLSPGVALALAQQKCRGHRLVR